VILAVYIAHCTSGIRKTGSMCKSAPKLVKCPVAVFASVGVDAPVMQSQALDRAVARDVAVDDLRDVGYGDVPIPDTFWVDHDGRTVFALIQAAGFVGADGIFQSTKSQFGLEGPLEFCRAGRVAASARMTLSTLIGAYEDVFDEFCHEAVV
jgi:hypothetical protein